MKVNIRHLVKLYRHFRDNPYAGYYQFFHELLVYWRDSGKITVASKNLIIEALNETEIAK